jgi:hypothetical protein
MATNHGKRPIGVTKKKVFGVEELHELKKVELITMKSSITNVLQ